MLVFAVLIPKTKPVQLALRRGLVLTLFAFAVAAAACNRSKASAESGDAGAEPPEALAAKYTAMSAGQRAQAALSGCYVGPTCEPAAAKALFAAAADEKEREALRSTARTAFAKQYQAALLAEGKKPDSVSITEEGRTLSVTGEICSRFVLENFANGKNGKVARAVGFWRFECNSQMLKAHVDLAG